MRAVAASSPSQPPPRNSTAMGKGSSSRTAVRMCSRPARPALKQHHAELAGGVERRERAAVGLPEQRLGFGGQVAQVDVAFAGGARRQEGLELGGQPLGGGTVPREQGKSLDVEEKAGRRARGPELSVAFVGRSVEGGVDLDYGKLRRVVAEAAGGAAHASRVKTARGDQRGVGPRAVADEDAPCLRVCHLTFHEPPPDGRVAFVTCSLAPRPAGARPLANVYVVMATPSSYSREATVARPSVTVVSQSVGGALWRHMSGPHRGRPGAGARRLVRRRPQDKSVPSGAADRQFLASASPSQRPPRAGRPAGVGAR